MTKEQYIQWLVDKAMFEDKYAMTPEDHDKAWQILKWTIYTVNSLIPSPDLPPVNIQEDVPVSNENQTKRQYIYLSPVFKYHVAQGFPDYDLKFLGLTWNGLLESEETMEFIYNNFCNYANDKNWCDTHNCPLDPVCTIWYGGDDRKAHLQECMEKLKEAGYVIVSEGE